MKARRFTEVGLKKFDEYLDQLETNGGLLPPKALLSDTEDSVPLAFDIDLENRRFATRFELAEYFHKIFLNANIIRIEQDAGLWAWCTLYYFDILCPLNDNGVRKPRERARYIPQPENYRKYYRHIILGSYLIYRTHKDNPSRAMALLFKPPYVHSEIQEQIAAYTELITNKTVVGLVTNLYYNPKSHSVKKGASGKDPGSVRRLTDVLNQFDLTWDLYAATPESLLDMLPKEFGKFAKSSG